ncbi:hypothetical protein PIB30_029914 [Stylosanthes scabra]|uniref:X8 domain-containing protein n=1 Tax=Stylosanthes scabra TaxID=79078 RepID=A0ABU6SBN5_9FABA|nr:hypothetical protein [Stylosanthes scabra]
MAMQTSSLCFLFISFYITSSCSGALVGFSYDERGEAATSLVSGGGGGNNGKTISLLHGTKVPKSYIRILVTDHRILESQTQVHSNNFSVDFYLNESLTENLITSKPSSLLLPWLNSHILNSLPELNIKTIIFSCGSECFTKNHIPSLLSSLRSVHSLVLTNEVKVKLSVAFPLSLLENLNAAASHKRDLSSILSFIKETKSYLMIEEDNMNNDVNSIVERATSVLGCRDVPLILSIKSKAISSLTKLSKLRDKMSRRIVALYVQEEDVFVESDKRRALDEETNSQNTVYPSNPAAPVITPPDTPTIITVPSTNPVTISPTTTTTTPSTMPVTIPSSTPVPLPPTTPTTINNPPAAPVTNPVTPSVQPPPAATTPTTPALPGGQSWCVAKNGAAEAALQAALDYACGMGGADCSQIQQGASCYSPVTLQNHASFAFNSYYQKHPGPTSCDFGGTATLVNTNPSTGSCIFPSSSSSSSQSPTTPMQSPPITMPTTPPTMPTTPPTIITTSPPSTPKSPPTPSTFTSPPTTPSSSSSSTSGSGTSGYGTPPSVLNSSNPTTSTSGLMPGFGSQTSPPESSTTTTSSSSSSSLTSFVQLLISFVTATLILRS